MKYFTAIDRVLNKIKRKGFFIYTAFVVAATAYVMYSVGNVPEVPPKPPKKVKDKKRTEPKSHPVDGWTRVQLYQFLANKRIYVDINDDLEQVRTRAKQLYDAASRASL